MSDRGVCSGCKQEISLDTCHCGDLIESHSIRSGHTAVPMGCQCGYYTKDERMHEQRNE